MPRRAKIALIGAAFGTALLVLTWFLAHYVGPFERADASILSGFVQLDRPRLDRVTNFIAGLCDPKSYVVLAGLPVIVALLRRRPRVALTLVVILLGANETTQLLKSVLSGPLVHVPGVYLTGGTWPSGHATAAMSLALCAVIAAPSRRRPVVAAGMGSFAIAVSYSFLELGWHYPSDVLGGFLVAATWTLLAVAALSIYEARRIRPGYSGVAAVRSERPPAFSLGQALAPAGAILAVALAFAGLIVLARPHQVVDYARAHEAFMVGALGIGALGLTLAYGVMLMLRRG